MAAAPVGRRIAVLAFSLLSRCAPTCLEGYAVSRSKRLVIAASMAVAAIATTASTSAAQPRSRRVVVRAPVIVGGYYTSPSWLYDPWFGFGYQYPWGPYPY